MASSSSAEGEANPAAETPGFAGKSQSRNKNRKRMEWFRRAAGVQISAAVPHGGFFCQLCRRRIGPGPVGRAQQAQGARARFDRNVDRICPGKTGVPQQGNEGELHHTGLKHTEKRAGRKGEAHRYGLPQNGLGPVESGCQKTAQIACQKRPAGRTVNEQGRHIQIPAGVQGAAGLAPLAAILFIERRHGQKIGGQPFPQFPFPPQQGGGIVYMKRVRCGNHAYSPLF